MGWCINPSCLWFSAANVLFTALSSPNTSPTAAQLHSFVKHAQSLVELLKCFNDDTARNEVNEWAPRLSSQPIVGAEQFSNGSERKRTSGDRDCIQICRGNSEGMQVAEGGVGRVVYQLTLGVNVHQEDPSESILNVF